jgi:hypothetical protein
MASTSKHYGDVVNWIEKVINSCETPLQEKTARKLIHQFELQYEEIDIKLNFELSRKLRNQLNEKTYTRLDKNFNSEELTQKPE